MRSFTPASSPRHDHSGQGQAQVADVGARAALRWNLDCPAQVAAGGRKSQRRTRYIGRGSFRVPEVVSLDSLWRFNPAEDPSSRRKELGADHATATCESARARFSQAAGISRLPAGRSRPRVRRGHRSATSRDRSDALRPRRRSKRLHVPPGLSVAHGLPGRRRSALRRLPPRTDRRSLAATAQHPEPRLLAGAGATRTDAGERRVAHDAAGRRHDRVHVFHALAGSRGQRLRSR